MAAFLDNCRFNPTLGGTTDWTYSSAVAGYQSPTAAGAVTTTVYEVFAIDASNNWEISRGACTITAGVPTFARTTVLYNSAGTGTATGQSGAGTKISFAAAPQVAVVAIKASLLSIEEANSFTAAQRQQARDNITVGLRGRLAGLTLSTAGASATFGVALGEAADSTAVDLLKLSSAYTKTTAAWAVGTGNGSFDGTGSAPTATSGWYHAYLIKRVDTGVVDVLTSNSATAPTLPTNYTLFRRIGSMKTNGSFQWVKFIQLGDEFLWDANVGDVVAATGSTAITTRTLTVPTGVQVNVLFSAGCIAGATDGRFFIFSPDVNSANALGGSSVPNIVVGPLGPASMQSFVPMNIRTNTSAQIKTSATTADGVLYINTQGWIDRRGRDV